MAEGRKRILVLVMDGLGDRACEDLRGLTPLQYIRTPNLDWFVDHGSAGLCDPIAPGIRPGSDTAHLAILGYDPRGVYTGRGPFEAMGIGMDIQPGDIALRCNFATVDADMNILDRRAGRIRAPETTELAEALDGMEIDGVECFVREGTEHRAVLVLRGDGLSPDITDADPGAGDSVQGVVALSEEAEFTAHVVNEFVRESHERLRLHPTNRKRAAAGLPEANILVPRGAGEFPYIEPFPERFGMSACCIAGVGLVRGICKACGLDIFPLPDVCNGTVESDLLKKAECAMEALEEYDFVLMNFKAPDILGHDGDARGKAEIVKRIDAVAGYLRRNMPDDLVVAITCDHCTPCNLEDHSGDPVPLTIYTHGCVRDEAREYSESGCSHGFIGRIRGTDLVNICMDLANRTVKFGS